MIQLRVKTEYSFGETYAPIDRIIERLKGQGCKAAGIVDESTWGHVEWFNKCKEAGIQPLLGVEIVVTDEDGDCPTPKMWFLAKNEDGLKELYRWGSKSYKQRVSNRRASPRLFRDDVLEMSSNIIKFAGDVTDEKFIMSFDCFLDTNPGSRVANGAKLAIAKKHGRRVVKTSDNAYSFEEDLEAFQFIERATQKPSPQHLIDLPECEVADEIANLCRDLSIPSAPMIRAEGNLEALCREGIKFRGMEECWSQQYEDRLNYELDLIESKDFTSYFLIVADMMCYAKEHMLVGPARGSSAGSLVCYLTRITEVDPIPPGLIFERFIDVTRTDLPDIDTDFPDNKRHMVFDYMEKKYGSRNTAHIGTVSRLKPKSALISVSKALGVPPQATGGVKAAMIERSSADSRANNCLEDTLRTTEPGKALLAMYPQIEMATKLEGHSSHTGVHAAGLLVCNDEIQNYAIVDDKGIAHVEKGAAEKLGLLKIDVLGLRTLGVLEDSGVPIDWYGLKFDDPAVYDLFNSGRFCGVFQFEGNALRAVSSDVEFRELGDIDAVTALARPGPFGGGVTEEFCKRKKGKKYEPMHPAVDIHLKDTFGLPVYQEQTMNIVRHVGQFSWKDTSTIRKAMSKRMGKEFFDRHLTGFIQGAKEQGVGEEEAEKVWELINSFGAWAFNKSHSHSYAVVSYWTAYLKAHHPLEFAAANLRNAKDEGSAVELLREMVKEGLEYVPFDIELSEENWSAKNGKLYGGFMALKGIGEAGAEKYMRKRNSGSLTQKDKEKILSLESAFTDIFPFNTLYGDFYENPAKHAIVCDKIYTIQEIQNLEKIPHGEALVFLGEVVYKNARDANEDVNIKKRGGKVLTGQTNFADMRLRDDTGTLGARIGRFDWLGMKNGAPGGKFFVESVPAGSHLLVRAKFFNDIRFAFVEKWKVLK